MDLFEQKWDCYFRHLCDYVGCPKSRLPLLRRLNEIPFEAVVNEKDKNRIGDAIYMRQLWCEETGTIFEIPDNEILGGTCSVLELLVSFAMRIDREYTNDSDEDHPEKIFWMMIENLGLNGRLVTGSETHIRVHKFIIGDIDEYGYGGLFPLRRHPNVDQRGKELWDQMLPWINENFF